MSGPAEYSGRVALLCIAASGGLPKQSVPQIEVTRDGILGNAVAHPNVHGGPDRALCLYSQEVIEALQTEGHPIRAGSTGENCTLAGLRWAELRPGLRLHMGAEVSVELTSYTTPCVQIGGSFLDRDFSRIHQKHHPGWSRLYARVLSPGIVCVCDRVRVE
jgi:MOSC domain-containing protein YiiM